MRWCSCASTHALVQSIPGLELMRWRPSQEQGHLCDRAQSIVVCDKSRVRRMHKTRTGVRRCGEAGPLRRALHVWRQARRMHFDMRHSAAALMGVRSNLV